MSMTSLRQHPLSQKEAMVIEPMADEVLIYDTKKNKLHVLSPLAATVWQQCDGRTSIPQIAAQLTVSTDRNDKENIVWLALEELEKTGLLQTQLSVPQDQLSRRAMLRKTAVAAVLAAPFVTSLIAPSPAHAQSLTSGGGATNGGGCRGRGGGNCGNGNGGGGGNGTGNEGNGGDDEDDEDDD